MELQITDHMFQSMNKLMFSTQEKLFVNHERIVSSRYSIAVAQFFFSVQIYDRYALTLNLNLPRRWGKYASNMHAALQGKQKGTNYQ